MQHGVADVTKAIGKVASVAGDVVSTLARVSARPAPESPLNAAVGRARRYVMIGTDLEDYRKVRTRLGRGSFADEVTVNDVILATIAGAFRSWLLTRGEAVYPGTTIRAMVPVSVHEGDDPPTGAQVTACFVDLPVGEPGAVDAPAPDRLLDAPADGGWLAPGGVGRHARRPRRVRAADDARARRPARRQVSRRLYNVVITNVPGPQTPLYAAGARMVSTYPVMPLGRGQALSIGLTSYDGGVYYGLNADRDAMPDADVLGRGVVDALHELLEAPRVGSR